MSAKRRYRGITDAELRREVWLITEELVRREIARRTADLDAVHRAVCIHTPSRCNGGGYDGCACGPYPKNPPSE